MQTQSQIFSNNQVIQEENQSLKAMLKERDEKLKFYEAENSHLLEVIKHLQKLKFGPRCERWESEEQYRLFNEAESEAKKPGPENEDETIEVKAHKKKRGKRRPLPSHLERRVEVIDLPEDEKFDEYGNPLKVIGKDVSEKLLYEPAKMEVIEYHRLRYGRDSGDPVKTAPPVPSVIPKGIATPELLSSIIVGKYADGMPLYRQEEIFGRNDIELSRQTMSRWVVRSSEVFRPLWNVLEDWLMSDDYISCDETRVQVLGESGRKNTSQSWMWVRSNPASEKKIILYNYDPHRTKEVVKQLFADFEGALQVDGYPSYDCLEERTNLIRLGCNMHGRRKFHEASTCGAKKGFSLAEQALRYYGQIYDVETLARKRNLDHDGRYELRMELAAPIWEEFKDWAEAKARGTPPKSKIGQAFGYFLREYEYLTGYLKNGKYEADNGYVERAIKYFATGRKAWLFAGSETGAEASELFYSIIITARLNGVNPYKLMVKLFTEIPLCKTLKDYERLAEFIVNPLKQ